MEPHVTIRSRVHQAGPGFGKAVGYILGCMHAFHAFFLNSLNVHLKPVHFTVCTSYQ